MRTFLAALPATSQRRILKKMDSTLRGNAGAEVRAMLEALPEMIAVVAPRVPETSTHGSRRHPCGQRATGDKTDFGRDLFSPVSDSRVAAHFDEPSVALSLRTIRAGRAALDAALDDARRRGFRIAIADAETDDDLQALAAVDRGRSDILWVGSAGLLESLSHPSNAAPLAAPPAVAGPLLFLVGSLSAMTQRQIARFAEHAPDDVFRVDPIALLEARDDLDLARAEAALHAGRTTLIALDGDRTRVEAALAWGEARGTGVAATSARLREIFIEVARPLIAAAARGAVVLSGGDVARTFCSTYGVRGLDLLAEAAPGIPISRAIGADRLLVTKAGGFGTPDTYLDIIHTLRQQVTV